MVNIIIGIILIVFAVFLIIAVLLQQGKAHNLSGTIAGGAETFFGKSKAQTLNKKLSILTSIVAVIFVIMVVTVYVVQDTTDYSNYKEGLASFFSRGDDKDDNSKADVTTAAETTAAETTAASTTAAETAGS